MKKHFEYYNPNPLKKKTGDCVVRALCKATGLDWDTIYRELCDIGFKLKVMPNDDKCWAQFLTAHGFTYKSLTPEKGSKRQTVAGFAKEHTGGACVLRVAHHLVTCIDGVYYDLNDFGGHCVYGYWKK